MKLNFFGDFVKFDTLPSFSPRLKYHLVDADYNIVNFEAPIHTDNTKDHKSGPCISQNKENPEWLLNNGFNIIALSNNHIFDFGNKGYLETKHAFGNVATIGAGTWEEAYKPIIVEKDGVKVGLLAFGELQFGFLHDHWSQADELGCAWINHSKVNVLIQETKKKCDFLIAIVHAGLEMVDIPLPEWRDRYRELIDVGCDAIIGGHPHIPQGFEIYNDKPIFYSLGNFCFSSLDGFASKIWNIGEMVSFEITEHGLTLDVKGVENRDGVLSVIDSSKWNHIIEALNEKLSEEKYMTLVNDICKQQLKVYWSLINMGGLIHPDKEFPKSIARHILNRYDHIHLLNLFQCESHRWCISRALRLECNTK